jgi:hypothetical protein
MMPSFSRAWMAREVAKILAQVGFIPGSPIRITDLDDTQRDVMCVVVNHRFVINVPWSMVPNDSVAVVREWLMMDVIFPQVLPHGF